MQTFHTALTNPPLTPTLRWMNQLPLNSLQNPIFLLQQINIKQNNSSNTEQYYQHQRICNIILTGGTYFLTVVSSYYYRRRYFQTGEKGWFLLQQKIRRRGTRIHCLDMDKVKLVESYQSDPLLSRD